MAITPNGNDAYVTGTGPVSSPVSSNTVKVIDTSTHAIVRTITVGKDPTGLAIS